MFKFSLTKNALMLLISIMTIVAMSCKPAAEKTADTGATMGGDLSGMVMEAIPGTNVQYARQMGANGNLEIEGYVENGKKTGMWILYGADGDIGLINHYVNGMMEGTAMRMSFRNQVDLRSNYKQNQLDGPWTAYKFGKVVETRNYKNGKLDGIARTFDDRTFKVKQEVQYKDGVQDGFFKYYDENGNVSLEYQYKNGEKVSGGIVGDKK